MIRAEELHRAILFNANHQIKTPETRKVIQACISKLRKGSPVEKLAAEEWAAVMDYQGSREAFNSAFYIQKAVFTKQGRKAAGIPPVTRGNEFKPQTVKQTDPIRQTLVLRELGRATDVDVDNAIADHLGFDYDERTKKKFIAGVMPGVKTDLFLLRLVSGEITFAQNSPKVNTST
jgi:hypothetical protein